MEVRSGLPALERQRSMELGQRQVQLLVTAHLRAGLAEQQQWLASEEHPKRSSVVELPVHRQERRHAALRWELHPQAIRA